MPRLTFVFLALAGLALGSQAVHAHGEDEPFLHVIDHELTQGEPFVLAGHDMDPDSPVVIEISFAGATRELGTTTTDPSGHFVEALRLPSDVPTGHASLQATSASGSVIVLSVWVGEGGPGSAVGPEFAGQPTWFDPSVLLLVGLVVASGLVFVLLLRSTGRRVGSRSRAGAPNGERGRVSRGVSEARLEKRRP